MNKFELNRTQLKIIAIIAMVIDHTAWGFVDFMSPLGQVMHIIGRLTLPIMCFFVAEGYRYTSDLKAYISRMVSFSIISIYPFYEFFHEEYGYRQNIIFDLTLALLALTVSEAKSLKKWQRYSLVALLFLVSAVIGGWIIMPIIYVLVFYYGKDFKDKAIKFSIYTVLMSVVLTTLIILNQHYHFSSYEWTVEERLYLIGFVIALIPLYFYNGKRGTNPLSNVRLGKYFFYIFYPAHFIVLAYLKTVLNNFSLESVYIAVHVLALFIALLILAYVLALHTTRAQMAVTFFLTSATMYIFGFLLEITAHEIESVYTATKLQYFAECFIFIAITLCMQELTHTRIPYPIYVFETFFSVFVMHCMFTWRENHLMYTGITISYDGPFPRMSIEGYGIAFYLFVAYSVLVCLLCVGVGIYSLRNHDDLQRKRLRLLLYAMLIMWIPYIFKMIGIFDKYEFPALTIPFSGLFVVLSLSKYSYLDSVALDFSNAINRGNEGVLVVDRNNRIMYHNDAVHSLFGNFTRFDNAKNIPKLYEVLKGDINTFTKDGHTYETRLEPLFERGQRTGSMVWVLDLTEHYEYLNSVEESANTDPLTGLDNRAHFEQQVKDLLERHIGGALFMVDLDNFKNVNDSFGHDAGDIVLDNLAIVIKNEQLRDKKHNLFAGRIGGDEFMLYYEGITDSKALSMFAHKLIDDFDNRLFTTKYPGTTSVSLGITIIKGVDINDETDFDTLYKKADDALYVAKKNGKKTFAFSE